MDNLTLAELVILANALTQIVRDSDTILAAVQRHLLKRIVKAPANREPDLPGST